MTIRCQCGASLLYQPVLDAGSGVLAAAHSDHDDGEQEEEAGHGEAHAVHRLVAHEDVTVHTRDDRATTETWNLGCHSTPTKTQGGLTMLLVFIYCNTCLMSNQILFPVKYLAQMFLHARKNQNAGHQSSQQQQEGEGQPGDGGVVCGRAA